MSLYVELPLTGPQRERVQELVGHTPVRFATPGALVNDDVEALTHARVAFGNCTPSWLAKAVRLQWLQLASVGVDAYLGLDWSVSHRDVVATNLGGLFADPVAETCVAGALALFRGIDRSVLLAADAEWDNAGIRPRLRLLSSAHVLVFGTGSIATRVVELLTPFGCAVTTFGRSQGDLRTIGDLEDSLGRADVVVGLLPGTPETAGLLDGRRLALLPPGAVIVNAGRGSLLDEDALVAGLRSGRLGGAVLDVTHDEPIPAGHPLWTAPNIILTQHTAGGSVDEMDRIIDLFADNWRRFTAGKNLRNVVRWSRGY